MPLYPPARRPTPRPSAGQYLWTASPATTTTSATLANGNLRVVPWMVETAMAIDRIGGEVTVIGDVGSKIRLGIYADNGAGYPGALLLDAGQIAGDSATTQELTVSLSLSAGLYWIGGAIQAVTTTQPTVRCVSAWTPPVMLSVGSSIPSSNATSWGYNQTSVTAALPANYTATVTTAGAAPRLFVRAA